MITKEQVEAIHKALLILAGCPPERADEAWEVLGPMEPPFTPEEVIHQVRGLIAQLPDRRPDGTPPAREPKG